MKNNIERVYISNSNTGKGLFAGRMFLPGKLILKFSGTRVDRDDPIHGTPLGSNLIQTGYKTYIMPESPGIFINHSCSPNAGIINNRKLVAIMKINEHDEITFDYSTTMDEDFWTMDCLCSKPICRGVIKDFKTIPIYLQQKYLSLEIVQKFIAHKYKELHKYTYLI
ncbi:MAG: SET domain-containing protein [Candidatus Dadabacteria bacterium]|nr:SET domain-containing protein [Candidatus Dadabacteria bacterium]NIS08827.1 SET domain-containing protein [Candidatus Dadabacteria bacterium]NIY22177.1 SET domain-containing protein-lysine N-methyltransferase [Candidatus Dadabacteria bacterium]